MLDFSNIENYSLFDLKSLKGNCSCFEDKCITNSEYWLVVCMWLSALSEMKIELIMS